MRSALALLALLVAVAAGAGTVDYAALKTEVQKAAYATPFNAGNDDGVAALLNARGGASNFLQAVAAADVIDALDPTEAAAFTATQWNELAALLAGGTVDLRRANTRAHWANLLASAPTSKAALVALAKRTASPMERLFGEGTTASPDDVARARRS